MVGSFGGSQMNSLNRYIVRSFRVIIVVTNIVIKYNKTSRNNVN